MKEAIDARYESKNDCAELTEDQFLEQFAALEESVTLLQAHMQSMSETVKLFGSLARHIRRSTCPTTVTRTGPLRMRLGPTLNLAVSDHRR